MEEQFPPVSVIKVKALDADSDENGEVRKSTMVCRHAGQRCSSALAHNNPAIALCWFGFCITYCANGFVRFTQIVSHYCIGV